MTADLDLGLALSGGGSRAAAFHRGTVRALGEVGLIPRVRTISSVSGGSVFAAAWLAARARKQSDAEFLSWMKEVLARGFLRPALLHWRALKLVSPWWSRTQRLAETFDEVLFDGVSWSDLPPSPLLCLNTTILNNAATGRFSQGGFSGRGVGARVAGRYPEGGVKGVTLGFATAASAAFPFGLPPLSIASDRFAFGLEEALADCRELLFTDGGIVENLGIERLLQSKRFGTKHVIASDAGVRDRPWTPAGTMGRVRSGLIFALSSEILERLLLIMSDKQNRSMRQLLYAEAFDRREAGRRVMFVRLAQDWEGLLGSADTQGGDRSQALSQARTIYDEMGGADAVKRANEVATGFSGLSIATLTLLEAHARWQVHALMALYGKDLIATA